MSTTLVPKREQQKRRSGGRPLFYGVSTTQFPIYIPNVGLKERLEDEALARNVRDRNPERAWNVSRVVVDILLGHFGMPKPEPQTNGHPPDPQ